jgi:F420-dependent oxidoreductase-like protein
MMVFFSETEEEIMKEEQMPRRRFLKIIGAATAAASMTKHYVAPRSAAAAPTPPGALRFGVQTSPQHTTYADILQVWREADELGFDTAFAFDHFIPIGGDPNGPCFEGWTLLSALAAQTKRLKVGLLVTGNTYRNPAVLAKMAATVDHVSNGRVILGIGAGWYEREHTAYGIPFSTASGRAHQLVEAVQVIKLLFTQDKSNFNGKYYQLKDAPFSPKTVQQPHPPILIGGMGQQVVQPLAARHADMWDFFAGDPEQAKQLNANFDKICQRVGRDPAQVVRSTSLQASQLRGDKDAVRGRIQGFADAGVQHFVLALSAPYDREFLRRFAKEVMPTFRQA